MAPPRIDRSRVPADVWILDGDGRQSIPDRLAAEEPLEILLRIGSRLREVALTMRTPGADRELALGFLLSEGILASPRDVVRVVQPERDSGESPGNRIVVELAAGHEADLSVLDRHFFTSSSCGVCGKVNLDSLRINRDSLAGSGPNLDWGTLARLPELLHSHQAVFRSTGSLHAAALFSADGKLIALREDVGRHNALDKVIGWAFEEQHLPLSERIVLVSGRASYEILQKSLAAGIPVVCAISGPSSLAVAVAKEFGVTLVGFLSDKRLNVYSGIERILE